MCFVQINVVSPNIPLGFMSNVYTTISRRTLTVFNVYKQTLQLLKCIRKLSLYSRLLKISRNVYEDCVVSTPD